MKRPLNKKPRALRLLWFEKCCICQAEVVATSKSKRDHTGRGGRDGPTACSLLTEELCRTPRAPQTLASPPQLLAALPSLLNSHHSSWQHCPGSSIPTRASQQDSPCGHCTGCSRSAFLVTTVCRDKSEFSQGAFSGK